ncbi:MAG: transcriptional repressor LexA [Bacteroidetes bacterium]|nr:transcriptional repressor LexA [Bacteroidota bacterium]
MKNELTEKQQDILNFIQEFIELNNYSPSYREIGKHFGIASTFGVKRHIDALIKKGCLNSESNFSRTLSVINNNSMVSKISHDNSVEIPVVGRVAAGFPILAQENIEGTLTLDSGLISKFKGCFGLKVKGDSMINAGIFEGDTVVINPQSDANNGEIIVALLGDEATLKRLGKRNNEMELIPENDKYPIISLNKREDFSIVGKVIGVFRWYN